MLVKRGEIYYADLGIGIGSEQNNVRPVLIIQNNVGNKYSPTTIIAVISSQQGKAKIPTHVEIFPTKENGLKFKSVVLLEQVRTIDEKRLCKKNNGRIDFLGKVDEQTMELVDKALMISLGLSK